MKSLSRMKDNFRTCLGTWFTLTQGRHIIRYITYAVFQIQQHNLLVMPLLPQKQSLGWDTSNPEELFLFFEHILGRVWLMLNRWVVSRSKYKVSPIPVSLHRNNYSFLRLFGRKKTLKCHYFFIHLPSAVGQCKAHCCVSSKKPEPQLSTLDYCFL